MRMQVARSLVRYNPSATGRDPPQVALSLLEQHNVFIIWASHCTSLTYAEVCGMSCKVERVESGNCCQNSSVYASVIRW